MGDTVKVEAGGREEGRQRLPPVPQNISEQLAGQLTMHKQKVKEGDALYLIINVSVDKGGKVSPLYDRSGDLQINVGKQRGSKVYDAQGSVIDVPYIKTPLKAELDGKVRGGKQIDLNALDWNASTKIDTGGFVGVSGPELKMPASIEWQKEQAGKMTLIPASLGRPEGGFLAPPDTRKYTGTLGTKLQAQYEKGVDAGVLDPNAGIYVYRMWSNSKVTETGLAYKNDAGTYVSVGSGDRVKGGADVLLVKPKSDAMKLLGQGALEPKAAKGEDGWDVIGAGQIQMPKTTGRQVELGRMTHYMVAEASPSTKKGRDAIIMQGTGVDSSGNYWSAVKTKSGWTVKEADGAHGAYKDGELTSIRNWSMAMRKWESGAMDAKALEKIAPLSIAGGSDKANCFYVFITGAGFIVARQDDTGGAFPSGTGKRDWFGGPQKQAATDWQKLVDAGVFKVVGSNFELNGQAYEFKPGDISGVAALVVELERQGLRAVR
jgi:hypothetical protein